MEEQKQDQKQDSGKVRKKFENDLAQLTQVLGGQTLYKPMTLVPTEVQEAVIKLAKKEKEKLIETFQEKALALIQKKRDHDGNVAKLKKEFEKKEEESMKSFSQEAQGLFKMLKDIKNIEQSYYDVLMGAVAGTPTEEHEDNDPGETASSNLP